MTCDAMIGTPALSLSDVAVRFGERVALHDVTVEIAAGRICALVGPNGAGKTSLLRLMAGTLAPSSGRIEWPNSGAQTRVALVSQRVALYPFLTLRENCLAAGRMEGIRGVALHARVRAAIERTLCVGMEDRLAGTLSGGYQRRAAIAAALMGDAPIVILDEPTTGLDTEAAEAISEIVRGLGREGRTVVIATHDFVFADSTADVALFLCDGALRMVGAPKRLCQDLFPSKKHVEISLAREPLPAQSALLDALDAHRLSPHRYSLFSDSDALDDLVAVRRLQEAGFSIRDMRVREPGIAVLFEQFCLDRRPS